MNIFPDMKILLEINRMRSNWSELTEITGIDNVQPSIVLVFLSEIPKPCEMLSENELAPERTLVNNELYRVFVRVIVMFVKTTVNRCRGVGSKRCLVALFVDPKPSYKTFQSLIQT